MPHDPLHGNRRQFLATTGLVAVSSAAAKDEPQKSSQTTRPHPAPRATSGDRSDPEWNDRLTITVGPKKADLVGATHHVIQAAVDMVAGYGGGTVKILPGTYRLRNAVHLRSGIRLLGSGTDSVLIKEPSSSSKLVLDSDWFDQEITLADAAGFQLGDGICLRAKNAHHEGAVVLKRTLVARSGNRFRLDRPLRENLWLMGNASASTLFALFDGDNVHDVTIENLCLDGNKSNNANLDGNYAGCIFLQDCNRFQIRKVTARNFNGDGISWQVCHDVTVEDCHSHDHTGLGLHPGSGSQRPTMRNNKLENNQIGLFFCWGVRGGLAEKNTMVGNRTGLSIGHRDTDNLIRDNVIKQSGVVGVLFRPERGKAFAPHRNRLEHNQILDSGGPTGIGIDIQGEVGELTFVKNTLRETRASAKRTGIRIGAKVGSVELIDNTIEGMANKLDDLRKSARK